MDCKEDMQAHLYNLNAQLYRLGHQGVKYAEVREKVNAILKDNFRVDLSDCETSAEEDTQDEGDEGQTEEEADSESPEEGSDSA